MLANRDYNRFYYITWKNRPDELEDWVLFQNGSCRHCKYLDNFPFITKKMNSVEKTKESIIYSTGRG